MAILTLVSNRDHINPNKAAADLLAAYNALCAVQDVAISLSNTNKAAASDLMPVIIELEVRIDRTFMKYEEARDTNTPSLLSQYCARLGLDE